MNNTKKVPVILVVDDEPVISETFRAIFEDNFEVLTSSSGKDALDRIAKNSINLIFLDISIPDMNGIQVLSRIKEYNKDLPVIIITGIDNQNTIMEARRLGASDYVHKPFDIKQVLTMTYKALRENRVLK
jgi:DNA-binding response OmpR family regulator